MLDVFVVIINSPSNVMQGFYEASERGYLSGHKICGLKFVLEDGKFFQVKYINVN